MNCHEKSSCINIYCCHGNGENGGNNGDNGGGTVIPGSLQTDWYVSNAGDNISGDGTQGNPFMTIQHAIDMVAMSLISTKQHTIHVADGTYTEALVIHGLNLNIIGNMNSPDNVKVGGTTDKLTVYVHACAFATFSGIQFECANLTGLDWGCTLSVMSTSTCWLENCIFNCDNDHIVDIDAKSNGVCFIENVSFIGSARWTAIASSIGATVYVYGQCFINNSTVVGSSLVNASIMGNLHVSAPLTLTSGMITGQRYLASQFGKIYGVSMLPTTGSPGTTATGGQVL